MKLTKINTIQKPIRLSFIFLFFLLSIVLDHNLVLLMFVIRCLNIFPRCSFNFFHLPYCIHFFDLSVLHHCLCNHPYCSFIFCLAMKCDLLFVHSSQAKLELGFLFFGKCRYITVYVQCGLHGIDHIWGTS